MKIEKIKNKYQVRKMIQGKTYYLFFESKPTKKEIEQELIKKINQAPAEPIKKNLTMAITEYIKNKSNVLSVSTIRGYDFILKRLQQFMITQIELNEITQKHIQQLINELAPVNKLKTIKNTIALIQATLNYNNIKNSYMLTYPKKIIKQPYIPTDNEIKKIDTELKGTKYYTFFRLALYGLRVSEILALDINDIDFINGTIKINKAKVKDIKNQYHIQATKTYTSNRVIKIDAELLNIIKNQNKILLVNENEFASKLKNILTKLHITHFSTHKLRHYMATKLHAMNIPSKYIQAIGGWATDNILKNIYTHTIDTQQQNYYTMLNAEYIKILN